jgi:inner membrane protein
MAAAGLRRKTPLAAAALIVGANLPDIDGLCYFAGDYRALAFRRGWTHGVLAMVVLPLALTAALMLWERFVRRRRLPNAPPVSPRALLALSTLAVATHPTLDWLNSYGLRWLMPFDGRWFYGDTLYIVDPWLWLSLGGSVFLATSNGAARLGGWLVLWGLMSVVVTVGGALAPLGVTIAWFVGVGLLLAMRIGLRVDEHRSARLATGALLLAGVYIATVGTAQRAAHAEATRALAAEGIGPLESVMVAPLPADPFHDQVVAATAEAFYAGVFDWGSEPKLKLDARRTPRPKDDALYRAAAATAEARRFLTWSRFPYVEVVPAADGGHVVRFFDARYGDTGALGGPAVHLDRNLAPVAVR